MSEVSEINAFMAQMGDDIEVICGVTFDDKLEGKVKVTLLATGSEMSVVPEDLREELRRKREEAAASGKKYSDDDSRDAASCVLTSEASQNSQLSTLHSQFKKPVDPMQEFQKKLYGEQQGNESKVSVSLDQIDDDDEMLRYMENVPAIKRN
jgi:cell division protein FtsZ